MGLSLSAGTIGENPRRADVRSRLAVTGGLSPNELRDLAAKHGSLEAAADARPELAGQIRGWLDLGGKITRAAEAAATRSLPRGFASKLTKPPERRLDGVAGASSQ